MREVIARNEQRRHRSARVDARATGTRRSAMWSVLVLLCGSVLGPAPTASAQSPILAFEYAAKVVCGIQKDPKDLRLARGLYATTVNIHNPNVNEVKLIKKLVLTFPEGFERPGAAKVIATEGLPFDDALQTDCLDLERRVFPNGFPAGYIEGFVVIESSASVDVTAVYSTGALDSAGNIIHSGIDVEQIRERRR